MSPLEGLTLPIKPGPLLWKETLPFRKVMLAEELMNWTHSSPTRSSFGQTALCHIALRPLNGREENNQYSDCEHHPSPWLDHLECSMHKIQVSMTFNRNSSTIVIIQIYWRNVDENYPGSHLIFTPSGGSGCYSSVGRDQSGRGQIVNLGSTECLAVGTIIHETLHSLGLFCNNGL